MLPWWDDLMRVLAVALLLVLAGCGGSSDKAPTATDSTPSAAITGAPGTTPTLQAPRGVPAPEALSRFSCAKNSNGRWTASGYVSNAGKNKATYRVTVYVGPAAGGAGKAKTKEVTDVAAGGSVGFVVGAIPAPKAGGPCHVQVLVGR